MNLRPYQRECVDIIMESDCRRQTIVMPTGCGKTVTFAALAKEMNVRTLILAHRDELLDQAIDKIRMVWPEVDIGKVKAETNEYTAQVVVASVQSATKDRRLEQLKEQNFKLCICDECHHSTADSYRKIIDELGFNDSTNNKLLVGFTATPNRSDGTGLDSVFDEIIFERTLQQMIAAGYLTDLKGQKVITRTNLDSIKTIAGDFAVNSLATAVNTPERNKIIVDSYIKYAAGKPAIAFCADVQHSKDLAEAFSAVNIPSVAVYGDMDINDRKEALRQFKEGTVKILTNCQVLTEGFDEASIGAVLMARPTRSTSAYIQMVGRGTRLHPGKNHCLVLDFFDSRHDICTLGTLAGKEVADGKTLSETIREHEEEQAQAAKVILESEYEFDMFARSNLQWFDVGNGDYRLNLDKNLSIYLRQSEGKYIAQLYENFMLTEELNNEPLELGYAQGIAEDYARKHAATLRLADRNASWRRKPATAPQKVILRKNGIQFTPKISAGDAADLIGAYMSQKEAWKFEPASKTQLQQLRMKGVKKLAGMTKGKAWELLKRN